MLNVVIYRHVIVYLISSVTSGYWTHCFNLLH